MFALLEKRNVPGAAYNSAERQRESVAPCQEGTREHFIAKVSQWVGGGRGGVERPIFWLHGPAGSGKTTIAHTIAEKFGIFLWAPFTMHAALQNPKKENDKCDAYGFYVASLLVQGDSFF